MPSSFKRRRAPAAVRKRFAIHFRRRDIPKAELIVDLRRAARRAAGAPLTIARYAEQGRFAPGTMTRRFGSWNEALAAARLPIVNQWNVPDGALLANLAEVWRKLDRQPAGRELTKADGLSRFGYATYKLRFGSWHKALIAFSRFIAAGGRGRGKAAGPAGTRTRTGAGSGRCGRRTPRNIGWRLRATVLMRDGCTCRMCGASPARDPGVTLHVDHIEPWAKGGDTVLANLQTLCSRCNLGKGDRAFKPPRAVRAHAKSRAVRAQAKSRALPAHTRSRRPSSRARYQGSARRVKAVMMAEALSR